MTKQLLNIHPPLVRLCVATAEQALRVPRSLVRSIASCGEGGSVFQHCGALAQQGQKNVSNGCGGFRGPQAGKGALPGVTLVETVIALMIIAVMASVLLSSQGFALRSSVSTMQEQEVVLALERRFVEIDKDHLDARKGVIKSELPETAPRGSIEFSAQRPPEGSALHSFGNLYQETLTARWSNRGRKVTTTLTRYRYVYEQPGESS